MKMGLSGAQVVRCGKYAAKFGLNMHIREQAERMRAMDPNGKILPKVIAIGKHHYIMERMERHLNAWEPMLVFTMLLDEVWTQATTEPEYWRCALRYFLITRGSRLIRTCDNAFAEIAGDEPRMTHGDPTWENTMLDRNGMMRLIDPTHVRPYFPQHRIIDIAKMCQSALGWEQRRYGWVMNPHSLQEFQVVLAHLRETNTPGMHHLWFWTACHFERIAFRAFAAGDTGLATWALSAVYHLRQHRNDSFTRKLAA